MNKRIRKGFRMLTSSVGTNLAEVAEVLILAHKKGDKICTEFNGHILYSDKTTMATAYQEVLGMTREEHEKKIAEELAEWGKIRVNYMLHQDKAIFIRKDKDEQGKPLSLEEQKKQIEEYIQRICD